MIMTTLSAFRNIRPARPEDSVILTEVSLAAKKYWNYPDEYFASWLAELTITPTYINHADVFVLEEAHRIIGYYSLVLQNLAGTVGTAHPEAGYWLEHMFVMPRYIGHNAGSEMISHLKAHCRGKNIAVLQVLADPNAKGFYEKMGFEYRGEYSSSIPGRTTPLLRLRLQYRLTPSIITNGQQTIAI